MEVIAILNGQNELAITREEQVLAKKCILNCSYLKKYLVIMNRKNPNNV